MSTRISFTELEISLYTEAKNAVVNNWRDIVSYMLHNQPEILKLPHNLQQRYRNALEGTDLKLRRNVQNRLKALSRKTRYFITKH